MAPPLLQRTDIHLTFGGTPLLTGAELSVGEGERLCLVGRNGSGKSTLLKIAAGLVEEAVDPDAHIIFGTTFDDTLDDEILVTVIATGFDENAAPTPPPRKNTSEDRQTPTEQETPTQENSIDKVYDDILKIFERDN